MKKFILGFVLGLLFGVVTVAYAAKIVGNDGYLIEWDVKYKGEIICSDPFIWVSIKEIDCGRD